MAKYSTRQRDALLDYLEKHAHELLSAKQISDELNSAITVMGTFDTYNDGTNQYCHLINAKMEYV